MQGNTFWSMANHLILLLLFWSLNLCSYKVEAQSSKIMPFHVGVILNLDSLGGKVAQSCITMAISDFYNIHADDYTTRLVLHVRNSKGDVVNAILEALDLIQNVGVQVIIGPESSEKVEFLAYMGTKAQVPLISFSSETSTPLSFTQFPYLVHMAQSDSSQIKAIAAMVQAYQWKEVALIHDDSQSGTAAISYLTDALEESGIVLTSKSAIPHITNGTIIRAALQKLSRTSMRVYIVHLLFPLATDFFLYVNELQMMQAGYVWIITCSLMNSLGYMDRPTLHSMEGVIGVRTHVPRSKALKKFKHRWQKLSRNINHKAKPTEPDVYALWAYDATFLVAMAANKAIPCWNISSSASNRNTRVSKSLFDVNISPVGPMLQQSILETQFNGISGDIQLMNGQLQSSILEIVNIMEGRGQTIGYWTPKAGLSPSLHPEDLEKNYSTNKKNLGLVKWPGGSIDVPITATFKIAVPVKTGFLEFINISRDPSNDSFTVTGFSKEVFDAVMQRLPCRYEYIPFNGSYDNLTHQVSSKMFDAAVGDLTIIASRSKYVDFSPPYLISGVRMVVLAEDDDFTNSFWWYVKPLSKELWLTVVAISLYISFMVWLFEGDINPEFQGTLSQRIGKTLFFSFSILAFTHNEKLESNYSRFLINMWTFAVVILTASYTANLTSMLAVDNLKPIVTDLNYLRIHEKFVGCQKGSFVVELLRDRGFSTKLLKELSTPKEYADALSRGSENGGVSAIVDEIPYINLFLSKYCGGYAVVGPTYPTGGFGFMFPKDSSLLLDVSQAVLEFTEGTHMNDIKKKWFGPQTCHDHTVAANITTSNKLRLYSCRSIIIFIMVASAIAVFFFYAPVTYRSLIDSTLVQKCKTKWLSISAMGQKPASAGEQQQNIEAMSESPSNHEDNDGLHIQHSDALHSNFPTGQLEQNGDGVAASTTSEIVEMEALPSD